MTKTGTLPRGSGTPVFTRLLTGLLLVLLPVGMAAAQGGWSEWQDLPAAAGELIAVPGLDVPTVTGGMSGQWGVRDDVLQLTGGAWQESLPLPLPLNHHAAVSLDGLVYVMGGASSFGAGMEPTASLHRFDPEAGTWERLADMPDARWGHGAASVGGLIYVVGGDAADDDVMLIYDPAIDRWSEGAPVPTRRDHAAVVEVDGQLLVAAGRQDGRNVSVTEIFDPGSGEWRTAAPIPTPRSGVAAAVIGGRLHVAGGEDLLSGTVSDAYEIYDPASDSWERAAPLPRHTHGAAGFAVDGSFAVVGGSELAGGETLRGWLDSAWIYRAPANP